MNPKKDHPQSADQIAHTFGYGPAARVARAPGRVNLIGEHTDYNGGLVLPIAIDRHTSVVFRPNSHETISVFANGINQADEFSIHDIQRSLDPTRQWCNYVRGTAWALAEKGITLKGGDLFIDSDLPVGAGLSSSAALEVATGLALLALAEQTMEPQALALCGQRAEHEFAGVRCGIMDQTVVACAKEGHALLLDCSNLKITHIPINLHDYSFAVFDTGVRHKLASSEYNKRRAECESAAKRLGRETLRAVTLDDVLAHIGALSANEEMRLRHVLTENIRVTQFASALQRGDTDELGQLLEASHMSLMNDYDVSCEELDAIVFELMDANDEIQNACPGSRMTGGGFGGSVVALLKTSNLEECERLVVTLAPGGGMLLKSVGGAKVLEL